MRQSGVADRGGFPLTHRSWGQNDGCPSAVSVCMYAWWGTLPEAAAEGLPAAQISLEGS